MGTRGKLVRKLCVTCGVARGYSVNAYHLYFVYGTSSTRISKVHSMHSKAELNMSISVLFRHAIVWLTISLPTWVVLLTRSLLRLSVPLRFIPAPVLPHNRISECGVLASLAAWMRSPDYRESPLHSTFCLRRIG